MLGGQCRSGYYHQMYLFLSPWEISWSHFRLHYAYQLWVEATSRRPQVKMLNKTNQSVKLQCYSQYWMIIFLFFRLLIDATSPVYLSTLANGKRVRGLEGIPSEGPVLYVGYHVLLGLEIVPVITQFLKERNIHLRGLAHPMLMWNIQDDRLVDPEMLDKYKMLGAVPVSNFNIYKLLQSKSHALLYPGGIRESFHRKVLFFLSHKSLCS